MDQRKKSRRALFAALSALVLLAFAFAVAFGPVYTGAARHASIDFSEFPLAGLLLTKYWQAVCVWDGPCEPAELFFDDMNAAYYARALGEGVEEPFALEGGEDAQAPRCSGLAVYSGQAYDAIELFNRNFRSLADELSADWNDVYFTIVNTATQEIWAPRTDLRDAQQQIEDDSAWKNLLLLEFNGAGSVVYQETWDASTNVLGISTGSHEFSAALRELSGEMTHLYDVRAPRAVRVLIGIPREHAQVGRLAALERQSVVTRCAAGFFELARIAYLLAALLALWTGRRRGAQPGRDTLARLPLDCSAGLLAVLAIVTDGLFFHYVMAAFETKPAGPALALTAAYALVPLAPCFFCVLAARYALAVYGLRAALLERSLTARLARRVWALGRRLGHFLREKILRAWRMLTRVDLRDPVDHTLMRLLAVNFLIVTFICCFWFLGILGTALYTVLLFFLLRGRVRREQAHYAALLGAARRMAEGDIVTPVTGDMGLFDPVRDELNAVRAGFEKAVEAEVRSRNMKTELITNVSHDLKTPLTAIITYIGLLRDPQLSEEDRAKYIDTLDRKSRRLGRLIEDLFEISKAASGNAVMHYTTVDLASLLRQAQCELADQIEASGIDFRWKLPEERLPLVLDGQKTYRILENLIGNIVKYGLPGTRAFITLTALEHGARIEFKNVSAAELDFDTAHITERFVRGDHARSTEGSGLGLAIVKSFAELQGGTFEVTTDGDLFKATVTLPDTNPASGEL